MKKHKVKTITEFPKPTQKEIERFTKKYVISENGCWEWRAAKNSHGYGFYTYRNRTWAAHRWSYSYHKGQLEDGALVCHKCDNKLCVNPEHLIAGDHFDNMIDAGNKGKMGPKKIHTECPKGHPYVGDNIMWRKGKFKMGMSCRKCHYDRRRAKKLKPQAPKQGGG